MNTRKEELESKAKRAVFLDRDGVINKVVIRDGVSCPPWSIGEFEILPGVREACATLKKAGYILVVASNQPDVGRGTIPQSAVEGINALMLRDLPIDRVEVCYHPGRGLSNCDCRKPKPGMLLRAASELGLDLSRSWMVGDRPSDIECGHSAGCKTILVGGSSKETPSVEPDFKAKDLLEAVTIILK